MPCGPVGLGDIEDSAQASKKTGGTLSESLQGDFGRSRVLDSPLLWLSCSSGDQVATNKYSREWDPWRPPIPRG